MCSRDLFHDHVTLILDLLTAFFLLRLTWTTSVSILVLIAQAVFLFQRGHADTHKVTDATDQHTLSPCIHQMNRTNSRNGSQPWWQHHKYLPYYYYYFLTRYFIPRVWDIKQSVWCLERLQWGLGNCESVRQADCVDTLDCRGDPLVQECRFTRVGGAQRSNLLFSPLGKSCRKGYMFYRP